MDDDSIITVGGIRMNNKGKARTLLDKAVRDAEYRTEGHLIISCSGRWGSLDFGLAAHGPSSLEVAYTRADAESAGVPGGGQGSAGGRI